MKKLLLLLITLICIGVASATLEATNIKYSWGRNLVSGGWSKVSFDLKNTGTVQEVGIIGLEHRTRAYSVVSLQSSCDPNFPNDVHRSYKLMPGESVVITLEANSFNAGGTFFPYLVHVDHCCINYACSAKEPLGWSYALNNGKSISFNDPKSTSNDQCDTDYQAGEFLKTKGIYNCKNAICYDASSFNSVAKCLDYGCIEGTPQFDVCTDKSSVVVRECKNAVWVETGGKCADTPMPPPPPSPSKTNWLAIGIIIIVVIGGLFLLTKK